MKHLHTTVYAAITLAALAAAWLQPEPLDLGADAGWHGLGATHPAQHASPGGRQGAAPR